MLLPWRRVAAFSMHGPAAQKRGNVVEPVWAMGLMSGTSLDGVDAALIRTDGERVAELGPWLSQPYEPEFRARLAAVLGRESVPADLVDELTDRHADAVRRLLAMAGLPAPLVAVVGFHGQTILHRPERRLTVQIGDAARLARATGLPVVGGLRLADVAAGGQGAPLAPAYHAALAADLPRPVAVLNLGGVGNVTWLGPQGAILAGDTGPANALIDDWALRHTGRAMDVDGALAAQGRVDEGVLARLLASPFFAKPFPKSLDRNDFDPGPVAVLGPADGAATLTAFTAACVARGALLLPSPPRQWLVTGGGRRNPVLMREISSRLQAPVAPVEKVGWRGDSLEAEAFGLLAVRSLRGLPLSWPGTTGVPTPQTGGVVANP